MGNYSAIWQKGGRQKLGVGSISKLEDDERLRHRLVILFLSFTWSRAFWYKELSGHLIDKYRQKMLATLSQPQTHYT